MIDVYKCHKGGMFLLLFLNMGIVIFTILKSYYFLLQRLLEQLLTLQGFGYFFKMSTDLH